MISNLGHTYNIKNLCDLSIEIKVCGSADPKL